MKILSYLSIVASVIFLSACGKPQESNTGDAGDSSTAIPTATATAEGYRFVIEGNDRMQFDINRFQVPAGVELTLVLDNVGTMNKQAMGHNWVLITQETPTDIFAADASGASQNEYIPENWMDSIIAYTAMTGGGEVVEVTFTVPEQLGDYDYLCTFPGHYYAGMKGVMEVVPAE